MSAPPVLLMRLDDRRAHVPSSIHGVALCGAVMADPWLAGKAELVLARAMFICGACHALTMKGGSYDRG